MSASSVRIDFGKEIATIQPGIYGQFAEHLGRCIYDGIWVGEDSPIPNDGGFRLDVVRALRKLRLPVVRWPGGCFADDYHWQDGIGPVGDRPRRINIHWGGVIETNAVGTHEFLHFCRLINTQPYFCGNVGSGSPRELRDWVEYCNFAGDSTWARMRRANGQDEPFGVEWWAVGNENWGCGGNFSPEDYCTEFRRFASFLPGFGSRLKLVACGSPGNDTTWTERFFQKLRKDYWNFENIHAFAAHYYCGMGGSATEYSEEEWYRLLLRAGMMEQLVLDQRRVMDEWDPQRRIGLLVDEWGTWHQVEKGTNPSFLFQQNTVRDAAVAASTLDIFNRHADKVVMANIAQMVNVLQALVLTEEGGGRMLTTPTYHVYDLYKEHQNGMALGLEVDAGEHSLPGGEQSQVLPLLSASASHRDGRYTLTLSNLSHAEDQEVFIPLPAAAAEAEGMVLYGKDFRACNTFDEPDLVAPRFLSLHADRDGLRLDLPAAGVARVQWKMAL